MILFQFQNCGTDKDRNGYTNGNGHTESDAHRALTPDHQPVQPPAVATQPVFIDLAGCNVGFKNWHPIPVIQDGDRLAGHGELGGVWEWTSTPLAPHEGFQAMEIYPGYTCKSLTWLTSDKG